MRTVYKIMVAFNFSSYAEEVLAYGAKLAEALGASLTIINVISQINVSVIQKAAIYNSTISFKDQVKRTREDRITRINQHIEEHNMAHLPIKILIMTGTPFEEIIKAVESDKIDLVIMGPKGPTRVPNTPYESTTEKMFCHCPVPIMSLCSSHKMETEERLPGRESA